jgi:hypothetical protein
MTKAAPSGFSKIEKLTKDHDVSAFSCGRESLDDWLKKFAWSSQAAGSANTYVVTHGGRVAGYYALMAGSIRVAEATVRAGKGQPRDGVVPVALIGRLARAIEFKGTGLGPALLKDALLRCVGAADVIGVRAILVHALDDEAKAFYTRYDFEPSPVDDMTLMLLMKDVRKTLG